MFCSVHSVHRALFTAPGSPQAVNADDLVDPADEGGDFDVDAWDVLPTAAKSCRTDGRVRQTGQKVAREGLNMPLLYA